MARTATDSNATVPSVHSDKVLCTYLVRGIRPLLMHNPAGSLKRSDGPKIRTIPSAEEEAEAATYRMVNGQLCAKSEWFFGSLVGPNGGASGRKFGKSSANSRILAGVNFDIEDECPLFDPETEDALHDYVIDIRPAVVNKARILRARPRLDKWACYLSVEVDERFITADQLEELLNNAGQVAGVADNRPQKRGRFGKYQVTLHARQ